MTADAQPPIRTTHMLPTLGGSWSYDTWGRNGRPVIFLHAILFDRAMWWPVAADLRTHCTAIAVDLPGHGTSPARPRYDPATLVEDLAHLLYDLGSTQAPIVVGHGTSAGLVAQFAARFVTHAVITVDAVETPGQHPPIGCDAVEQYLAAMHTDHLPPYYRTLATARPEPGLFAGYAGCLPEALGTDRFVTTRHQRFAHARLPDPHLTRSSSRLFRSAHHERHLTDAACGGLRPPPAGRPRRTYLHLLHSTASSDSYIEPSFSVRDTQPLG